MPVLMGIDIETYSSAPLPRCGVRYVYLTRIHIRSETLADQRMKRLYGVPLLDSEARGQFVAARCAMERFQTDYALRLACPAEGCTARLDLDAAWSCA